MTGTVSCISAGGRLVTDTLASHLSPDLRETTRVEANAWIKRLRLADYDGQTMRERFQYPGDSLWWFTEIYLHKMRRIDTAVATTFALETAREKHAPIRIEVTSSDPTVRAVAIAFGTAHRVPVALNGDPARGRPRAWPSYLVGLSAKLSRLRTPRARPARSPRVAAFVHTAFWRTGGDQQAGHPESYVGLVLDAIARHAGPDDLFCVGIGPRRNFRSRRWWDPIAAASGDERRPITPIEHLAPRESVAPALAFWARRHAMAEAITSGEGIRAAAVFRGLDLWPVVEGELESVALIQWPWSARAMDEAGAALDALAPQVMVTYAEAGGWGRALVLEARRRGIASVGLQHGFIYRHWLNYLHELDELQSHGDDRGFPAPNRTLVFDGDAARHLREAAHLPSGSLVVTGSPRLDELAARIAHLGPDDRIAVRQSAGAADGTRLVLLAAKFSELGEEWPALVAAVARRADLHLVVKTHPAETASPYEALADPVPNITIRPAQADLAALVASADAVVTRNSTVAIDALALGVPALVIGLPSNLTPFVTAGVMRGATTADEIERGFEALLYDREARQALETASGAFLDRHAMRPDGGAADRAAAAVLDAGRTPEVTA